MITTVFLSRKAMCLGVVALVGCATQPVPQKTFAQIMADDPTGHCARELTSSGPLAALKEQKGVGAARPSLEQLADKTVPSDAEKPLLSAFSSGRDRCYEAGAAYRNSNLPPQVVYALNQASERARSDLAALYAGQITYGQFNRKRAESINQLNADLNAVDRSNAAASAQLEAERRALAGQLLLINAQQPAYQIPAPTPYRPPTTTDCQRTILGMSCTTR